MGGNEALEGHKISCAEGISCSVCEECSGMKCPIFFIHSMAALIETTRNSESNYIIANGSNMLKSFGYRNVPKSELTSSMAKLMHECKGCFAHDDNCIINLCMQAVYYLLFSKMDRLDVSGRPLSVLSSMRKVNTDVAARTGALYIKSNDNIIKLA